MGFTGTAGDGGALSWGTHHVGSATSSWRAEQRLWETKDLARDTFNFCISCVRAQNSSVPVLQPEPALLHYWQCWSAGCFLTVCGSTGGAQIQRESWTWTVHLHLLYQRSLSVCPFLLCPSLQVLRKVMAEVKTSVSGSFSVVSFCRLLWPQGMSDRPRSETGLNLWFPYCGELAGEDNNVLRSLVLPS